MNLRIFIIFSFIFAYAASPAFCEEPEAWLTIEGGVITVEYESSVSLKAVNSKLNRRGMFSNGFFSSESSADTPEGEVAERLERLLKRAEEILDMYPPKMKLVVKIFAEDDSLQDAYFRIFGTRPGYRAFYIHEYGTIYTSEYGISDSVIIHEMAHAIIDNYFSANPPPKVGEILSTYVDMHLDD